MLGRILLNVVMGGSVGLFITGCAATRPQATQAGGQAGRQTTLPEARPLGAQYRTTGPDTKSGKVFQKNHARVALPPTSSVELA